MGTGAGLDVVTGAYGYTCRHIAARLLQQGRRVRALTRRPERPSSLAQVEALPWAFDDPLEPARRLEGVSILYNTDWVRFPRGDVSFDLAVENSRALFHAARRAGVSRVVHGSITNPSASSRLGYFRGKALVERALVETGPAVRRRAAHRGVRVGRRAGQQHRLAPAALSRVRHTRRGGQPIAPGRRAPCGGVRSRTEHAAG